MRGDKENSAIFHNCIKHHASLGMSLIKEMEDVYNKNYFQMSKNRSWHWKMERTPMLTDRRNGIIEMIILLKAL